MPFTAIQVALLVLHVCSFVAGHVDGSGMEMNTMNTSLHMPTQYDENWKMPSYAGLPEHSSALVGHVVFMVLAWFLVLPVAIMFSIARSNLALPTQFTFLALNGAGLICGTVYNVKTPDLYEKNAHHTIGWITTYIITAQVVLSLMFSYSGIRKAESVRQGEQAPFLPVSVEAMAQHDAQAYKDYRWSGDSGQGTERSSRDVSPTDSSRCDRSEPYDQGIHEPEEEDEEVEKGPERGGFLRSTSTRIDKYLSCRLPGMFSKKLLRIFEVLYITVDRTILLLGFIAFLTGLVTYAGIFRSDAVLNGLAHFVKGGIFFWYGLLTLGRWSGAFSALGWSWNLRPTEASQWEARMPSAEFTESFVIFLYGCTNVFLEHLAAWGDVWTASDLEHLAITVMFFGGGLCGMLVESTSVRNWLNTAVEMLPERQTVHLPEAQRARSPPHSLNVIPALIIFLLGLMMSSHHQDSMVSTMVHAQWGHLLVGFSLARIVTYIVHYVSPPTSVFPSRPPSELIASFCLVAGGIIFMGSTKDVVHLMEDHHVDAMFLFTITMGITALLMAWTIALLSLKGWATRRGQRAALTCGY